MICPPTPRLSKSRAACPRCGSSALTSRALPTDAALRLHASCASWGIAGACVPQATSSPINTLWRGGQDLTKWKSQRPKPGVSQRRAGSFVPIGRRMTTKPSYGADLPFTLHISKLTRGYRFKSPIIDIMNEISSMTEAKPIKTPTLPDAQTVTQVKHYTDRLFSFRCTRPARLRLSLIHI